MIRELPAGWCVCDQGERIGGRVEARGQIIGAPDKSLTISGGGKIAES